MSSAADLVHYCQKQPLVIELAKHNNHLLKHKEKTMNRREFVLTGVTSLGAAASVAAAPILDSEVDIKLPIIQFVSNRCIGNLEEIFQGIAWVKSDWKEEQETVAFLPQNRQIETTIHEDNRVETYYGKVKIKRYRGNYLVPYSISFAPTADSLRGSVDAKTLTY